jgi:hypothetical protein
MHVLYAYVVGVGFVNAQYNLRDTFFPFASLFLSQPNVLGSAFQVEPAFGVE